MSREFYSADDTRLMVFVPGYPFFVAIIQQFIGSEFHITAMMVNVYAFLISMILATELLAAKLLQSRHYFLVFAFSLTSPVAFFILPAYSDTLFSALIWGALYCALMRQQSNQTRALEASLLFLAAWVRITGFSLLSWLLLRRSGAIVILFALAGWMAINYYITGNPLFFAFEAQRNFGVPEGGFATGFNLALKGILDPTIYAEENNAKWLYYLCRSVLPIVYFPCLCLTAIWFYLKKHPLIALTLFSILAISHNRGLWMSVVRYDLPLIICLCIPLLYLAIQGKTGRGKIIPYGILALIALIQFYLQTLLASSFKQGISIFA
ncbi:MAG: hypothetical protein EBR02_02235 [Alphaproteobacteria bacterium]|nr:hypothetical protein [Alphaproteobacteria bacterium]